MQDITDGLVRPRDLNPTRTAARSGMTNGSMKVNRLRLERAKLEVKYFEHLLAGGKSLDAEASRLRSGIEALRAEIAANVKYEEG
jgi:hypothetical protein